MSGASSRFSQFFIGMLKPSLDRSRIDAGSTSARARFRTYLRSRPRIFSRPGMENASSMTSTSRNGARVSSEAAMLMRSTFTRMSSAR